MALDAELREILQKMETDLKITIQLDTLLPILCKKHLVTQTEHQRLSNDKDSDAEKNGKLVRIIQGKGENAFDLFVEALKEEKDHIGHGSLAQKLSRERGRKTRDASEERPNCKESRDLSRPEPLPRATRKKGPPPPPPPKPPTQSIQKQEVESTKYLLSVRDDNPLQSISFFMSDMNDQMEKLSSRIRHVESDIKEMKEAVLNKSLQLAVEGIQNTLSGLVDTLKEADYMQTEMKTLTHQPIPVTSPSQDFDEMYISASVENEYVETAYVNSIAGPTIKLTERSTAVVNNDPECVYDTAYNTNYPPRYMTLEAAGGYDSSNEYHYVKRVKQNRFKQEDYVEEQILTNGKNGEIWLAVNKKSGSKVVIKKAISKEAFTQEANALMRISHPNVIRLIDSFIKSTPSLIFEYAENGDLLNCLRSKTNAFSVSQLLAMGANVANGMVQLEQCGIIHCDLKARSILIDSHFMCKIGAFNKARCLQPGESSYTPPSRVAISLPIKWLAPELLQKRKFSIKSDVWAFAVLLSEIFSQGNTPYPKMDNSQVKDAIQKGKTMVQPAGCPNKVFEVMKTCFRPHAKSRPSFSTVYQQLKDLHSMSSREATSSGSECEEI